MSGLGEFLKKIFYGKEAASEADLEEFRIAFKARYHSFKLLLNANKKALEVMAILEETLRSTKPYGLTHMRSLCTQIATHVFQLIKYLDDLAPGKYDALHQRFKEIQERINSSLSPSKPVIDEKGKLVLPMNAVRSELADQVGGKIANLGEIGNALGIKVPDGFVVTVRGYRRFIEHNNLQAEINRRRQAAGAQRYDHLHEVCGKIQQLVLDAELPEDLAHALQEEYGLLEKTAGEGVTVAVRSSALLEDVAGASFAGQHHSELNVSRHYLSKSYKMVVASKFGLPAMIYRMSRGIRDDEVAMCVGCLVMVNAVAGGVLYTRNPMDEQDDSVIINSSWGLPKAVVDGRTAVDLFVIERHEHLRIESRRIPQKDRKFICSPHEGICRTETTDAERASPSLTNDQALDLAHIALRIEKHYGSPRDIEWALDPDGTFTILQCRRLQQKKASEETATDESLEPEPGPVIVKGGTTASPGVAAGPVYVVQKDMDALHFPEGAVLATVQSLPRWAPLLERAAAVVSEHGTSACHLANVAREIGVPALFGIRGVIDKLENGREVTVNADGCTILDGRIEPLLKKTTRKPRARRGSPLHRALTGAARNITPLNLLDPDAAEFRPEHCRTYHDITRFCHEKAVIEMFHFGKDHRFPERSSKQLYCEVPMQWWVLNLDDGFKEEVEGKFVGLDNIASAPMLALWEGITAVPWDGPPPVSGRGFMSVIFDATTNPALNLGVRSEYANRNYFMISREFCCLNLRLGAHFTGVEVLATERRRENYIRFQFKGGGANYKRRIKRIHLLKDILDEYGFQVETHEDNLIAHMEGRGPKFMIRRLKLLGYLSIHTRQIDMIMTTPAMVDHYREKMHSDIGRILSGG